MSILSEFEDRIGRTIEGMFAGVFRAPVQPAELARACGKEMDRRKKLGVGKVYGPTSYSILLSPDDGDQLGGFAPTLAGELETYLMGHAQERGYELADRPLVRFLVDDELRLGRFEVIGELLSPEELAVLRAAEEPFDEEDAPEEFGAIEATPFAPIAAEPTAPAFENDGVWGEDVATGLPATITVPGFSHDIVLDGERFVIGRLKTCEVGIDDVNASRRHAAIEREGSGWAVVDLGSTNGTLVNDQPVTRTRLLDGDVITIGVTELTFHDPKA